MSDQVGVAIVGCGHISREYARDLLGYPEVDLRGVSDLDPGRARALAEEFGLATYPDLDAVLADPGVDVVVNLTIHTAHHDVSARALSAGRHVFSEKPLAMTAGQARELVELAERHRVLLGCAPATFLGEAQQTALALVRDGATGPVRLVFAEVNWGRLELYHPRPQPFYEIGVLFDVGCYPLSLVTAALGPVRRVSAWGRLLRPTQVALDGTPFTITTPDLVVCLAELASGAVLRLTADFYVGHETTRQTGAEFHGDLGTVALSSWHDGDARVSAAPYGAGLQPVPLLREPARPGVERGLGVRDLVAALAEDRRPRADGAHAAHVVEVLDAARRSYESGEPVDVHSSFHAPQPWPWAQPVPAS